MKLWEKNIPLNAAVERFTIGRDPEFDLLLAPYDVIGSLAHARMLAEIGVLTAPEEHALRGALHEIYAETQAGSFVIEDGVEDVHSQVEKILTAALGDVGKKIHTARSRNDQVLVDLRLMLRDDIRSIVRSITELFDTLQLLSEKHKEDLLPGYTHLQAAMPSSFGLWFGAYAENLIDDLRLWQAVFDVINQNPLGSGAGYGSSLPIDRLLTTQLLGFKHLDYNVVHAQMGRGRSELFVAFALSGTANTLSKLAMDVCLYNSQDLAFVRLPDAFTTGSSIMPHKKNPDVFELIRAKSNALMQLPGVIAGTIGHLPSGYHRDFQQTKEQLIPSMQDLRACLDMATLALSQIEVRKGILKDARYQPIYSVERVNALVNSGVPFREAYQMVAKENQVGADSAPPPLSHSHEGSLGHLCNEEIKAKKDTVLAAFDFGYAEKIETLLS